MAFTDAAGATTQYRYDGRGNLVESINSLCQPTQLAYDSRGLPTAITDALDKTKGSL